MRKRDYVEGDLYLENGRYGNWNWKSIAVMAAGTIVGWGFVTNPFASWLQWQGYLLGIFGGKSGAWAGANLGVFFALVIGFIGYWLTARRAIWRQENS